MEKNTFFIQPFTSQIGGEKIAGKWWYEMKSIPSCFTSFHYYFLNPNNGTLI
jgi:hypothetical protein